LSDGVWLLLAVVSVVLVTWLRALQLSLRTIGRSGLEALAGKAGKPGAQKRVKAILADTDGHAAAVAILSTAFMLVTAVATVQWVAGLRTHAAPGVWDFVIGLAGATLVLWCLGFALPLAIATHLGERSVFAFARFIRGVHALLAPARPVNAFFGELVRRLAGVREDEDPLEAELLSVVEEGEREGRFDEADRDMIEAVVDFSSTTVSQIMTPRTEVHALEYTDDLDAVMRFVTEAGHSRVPVFEENLDHVLGLLYARDLLEWMCSDDAKAGQPFVLREILRDAVFVPGTKTIRQLLEELLAERVHIAMVADEYGGTSGLITIEDMVEEIFGEIQDEYDEDEDETPSVDLDPEHRTAEIDARVEIDDANDRLEDIGVELPESGDYDTVGGFVVVSLGRIPNAGDTFEHENLLITVLEAEPTRVKRVRVAVGSPSDDGAG